eukprot:CAMPEP_0194355184 /NCGR_PEP_ID=MMETSP0174-20130528/3152_1 /TAXON_ID=216777 /ORGANISM="Proboscia alata, Strain PI-D3" /LENGTH=757 /DNA_ID=CAMNT_0039124381 /DNA_START=60 /DNA_END=2333 /DNA_ORIENTATION=-
MNGDYGSHETNGTNGISSPSNNGLDDAARGQHDETNGEEEPDGHRERRNSIKAIMTDEALTPFERRKSIQYLMDGRRRSLSSRCSSAHSSVSDHNATIPDQAMTGTGSDDGSDDFELEDGTTVEFQDHYSDSLAVSESSRSNATEQHLSMNDDAMINQDQHMQQQHYQQNSNGTTSDANTSSVQAAAVKSTKPKKKHSRFMRRATINFLGKSNKSQIEEPAPEQPAPSNNAFVCRETNAKLSAATRKRNDFNQLNREMEKKRPSCTHYERSCSIIAPCCGMAFGCRICHDEYPELPPPLHTLQNWRRKANAMVTSSIGDDGCPPANSGGGRRVSRSSSMPMNQTMDDHYEHHNIDRFAISETICRKCYTRQTSKTNQCINCRAQFGDYHCDICNLWMQDVEEPYHCHDCGFCRVGGRDNFRHCHDCGMCIDATLFGEHSCKIGKYMSNCPVCQEDLFSSRSASHEMPCGHAIHWHCFRELTTFDSRCPVCKKTVETAERMAPTWSAMAMAIALQPVPPDLAQMVSIVCNDCERKDEDRRWHFLGVQCRSCSSFNTMIEQILLKGPDAARYLDENETSPSPYVSQYGRELASSHAAGDGIAPRMGRRSSMGAIPNNNMDGAASALNGGEDSEIAAAREILSAHAAAGGADYFMATGGRMFSSAHGSSDDDDGDEFSERQHSSSTGGGGERNWGQQNYFDNGSTSTGAMARRTGMNEDIDDYVNQSGGTTTELVDNLNYNIHTQLDNMNMTDDNEADDI